MKSNTLCWADIPVLDLDRAIRFYSAVFGAPVTRQSGPDFECGLLPNDGTQVSGCLVVSKENRPSLNGPLIYLSVEGRLDEALRAARSHGAYLLEEKHEIAPFGFVAILVDCEGNRIGLHSSAA